MGLEFGVCGSVLSAYTNASRKGSLVRNVLSLFAHVGFVSTLAFPVMAELADLQVVGPHVL